MSERILVRPTHGRIYFGIAMLGVVAMMAGIVVSINVLPEAGAPFLVVGLGIIAICLIAYLRERRRRLWATLTPQSLILEDHRGEREVRDDDIVALAYRHEIKYLNGNPTGRNHDLRLWALDEESSPQLIHLRTSHKLGEPYPLEPLFVRVLDRLTREQTDAYASGRKILGERWSIERKELELKPVKGPPVSVPLDEIVAADVVDRQLSIWKRGEEFPWAAIPADSANAYLLKVFLNDHLAKQGRAEEPAHEHDLGRVVFERKASRAGRNTIGLLAGLSVFAALTLFMTAAMVPRRQPGLIVFGFAALGLAAILAWAWWYKGRWFFRAHTFGLSYRGQGEEQRLRFEDVEQFTCAATRHYHNGAYVGTNFNFQLVPRPGTPSKKIQYTGTIKNADDELDNLRDQISHILAAGWYRRLAAGETIVWTKNLTLKPEGIEYRPSGWIGRKESEFLPYTRVQGFNLDQGKFQLFEIDKKKPVMTESSSETNFFPGYYALAALFQAPRPIESEA